MDPKEKLAGSTSVACWLVPLVKASLLSLRSGVVAGGKFEPELLELLFGTKFEVEPQLSPKRIAHA